MILERLSIGATELDNRIQLMLQEATSKSVFHPKLINMGLVGVSSTTEFRSVVQKLQNLIGEPQRDSKF